MIKKIFKRTIVWILTCEARVVLWKYKPRIVGVTGSVGKSSTKDAIFTALSSGVYVRKSQKSFNSEFGIPLTILGCDTAWSNPFLWIKNIFTGLAVIVFPNHYPKWLVLEIGLDKPGDIKQIVRWLPLDVVVYTRLSKRPVHVEFFKNADELIQEKKELMKALRSNGLLIINKDDPLQNDFRKENTTRISYDIQGNAAVHGSHISIMYGNGAPKGMTFRINHGGSSIPIELSGVLGHQHVYPLLAGYSVAMGLKMNLIAVGTKFSKHTYLPGRMRILKGINDSYIIDDSYNASPVATRAALRVLGEVNTPSDSGRKIAILGDMTELGTLTEETHKEVGEYVASVADIFVAVGEHMKTAVLVAYGSGMEKNKIVTFHDSRNARNSIREIVRGGDIVLIKGSQAMRMELIVKELLKDKEKASDLLVRQGRVWLKR